MYSGKIAVPPGVGGIVKILFWLKETGIIGRYLLIR
jgi:hypothetical protein